MTSHTPPRARRRCGSNAAVLVALGAALPALQSCSSGGGEAAEQLAAPLLAAYATNPVTYTVGETIAPNAPQVTGQADAWSVVPALPDGLALDPSSGVVSGQPTDTAASATYAVTVTNAGGSDTLDLVIEVLPAPFGSTEMASRNASGTPGDSGSSQVSIARNGQKTVFASFASNLVDDDTNGRQDVFVRDNDSGVITRVSLGETGAEIGDGNSSSPSSDLDGSDIAFVAESDALSDKDFNGANDVYVREIFNGITERVSLTDAGAEANGDSADPSMAADAGSVAFRSTATNLVAGDTNGDSDIFVRDRVASTTTRVSVADDGSQANDGSFEPARASDLDITAFSSVATNLVAGDTNGVRDVFYRNVFPGQTFAETVRVSVSTSGLQADGDSGTPAISASGRFLVFQSSATNLVTGDTNGVADVFWHDRLTQVTERVSVTSSGAEANGASRFPSVSDDGRFVTFDSEASNLVAGDTNGVRDVFRHDRSTGETIRLNEAPDGTQATQQGFTPDVSANGRDAAFVSRADELDGATGGQNQAFVRRLPQTSSQTGPDAGPLALPSIGVTAPGALVGGLRIERGAIARAAAVASGSAPAWLSVEVDADGRIAVELYPGGLAPGLHEHDCVLVDALGEAVAVLPVAVRVD